MTDAAKALRTRRELGFEDGRDAVTQTEIDRADDARRGTQVTVPAARAFRRDALHKLGLADHAELFGTLGAIH